MDGNVDAQLLARAEAVYVATLSDAMDALGQRAHVVDGQFQRFGERESITGWAFTIQGTRSAVTDTSERIGPRVIDEIPAGSVVCYSTGGVMDVGVWGELWSTGVVARGCVGAVVDGCVRDIARIKGQSIGLFARGASPRDAVGRFTVLSRQVPVAIGGVAVHPGDLVKADADGVIVVPRHLVEEAVIRAEQRAALEVGVLGRLNEGVGAGKAYEEAGAF